MRLRSPIPLLAPVLLAALSVSAAPPASLGGSAADVIEVDLARLTTIRWEPGSELPPDIQALDGRTVVIRGYMHSSVQEDVHEFPMVSEACQCAGKLRVHHFVQVDLGSDTTRPVPGQFEVVGRLSVGERWEDGFCTSLYRLRGRFY